MSELQKPQCGPQDVLVLCWFLPLFLNSGRYTVRASPVLSRHGLSPAGPTQKPLQIQPPHRGLLPWGSRHRQSYHKYNITANITDLGPFRYYKPIAPSGSSKTERLRLGYLTGSQTESNVYYRKPGQAISGAITLAVDEINNTPDILPGHLLEFLIAETYGQEVVSIRRAVELLTYNVSAYIGPQETCVQEGRLAAAFNKPMISYFCSNYEVSNKELYPTFARTKPHDSRISMSVVSLLQKYNWRKVVFVYNKEMPDIADTIAKVLRSRGINVTDKRVYDGPYFHEQHSTPFGRIVAETYQKTRIYLMLGEYFEFVGLMVSLLLRGLLDTGEYFVVGVDSRQYNPKTPRIYLEGLFQTMPTEDSIKAFRSFLLIAPAPPVYPGYDSFTTVVNYYLEDAPFDFSNPYRKDGKQKILRPEAAYLYDAVWLYARAAHQLLTEGRDPTNGTEILGLIKETTYESAMGYMTRLDANGDAEGNFTLCARQSLNGSWGLFPVGTFSLNQNAAGLPVLRLQDSQDIDWVSGSPPVDEPDCGFYGEKCLPGPDYTPQILGGVLGGLAFILIIVAVVMYRNWHYEQELASLLWKIDYKDIIIRDHISQHSGTYSNQPITRAHNFRSSTASLASQVDVDLRQVFTQVCSYRGAIVAVKRINKRTIDLTRAVRKELKVMRDVRHDNLNGFVGACVDPGNICIITEYCTRGSLQDILANDDVKLDNMFLASLVFDILKGLLYLHDCVLRSHGRFKSSNCVVDSRWVLKITDYGLTEFKSGADADRDPAEHAYYQGLLWTAPELLRSSVPPLAGTQQGDVYSFAIVLYEMYGRAGPYGDTETSPRDIIQRLILADTDVPYRPKLAALGAVPKFVTDCIKDAWAEDPLARPDLKTIRNKLKPLQKGMKPNIFDNMMAIMERYATNLEDIVEERTDQLREEKKKTEELLHQMLPKSVAEQLKQGKLVEAEAFDNVTIYFSDICDFTALSSHSTPMQVIDLLNDLYTTFDAILENYDVYKVETIGDAYMVVSGLPKRNGIQHAAEIASMSLHLLSAIKRFKIRHRPSDTLKLRVGLHSGPVVVGVVGRKMPRYCLFGDTVNTSARMESNGLPLRIHCSLPTKDLLDQIGGFHIEERGLVSMKGKGEMRTFWINGEDKERRMARLALPPPNVTLSPDSSPTTTKITRSPAMVRSDGMTLRSSLKRRYQPVSKVESPLERYDHGLPNGPLPNGYVSLREVAEMDDDIPLVSVTSSTKTSPVTLPVASAKKAPSTLTTSVDICASCNKRRIIIAQPPNCQSASPMQPEQQQLKLHSPQCCCVVDVSGTNPGSVRSPLNSGDPYCMVAPASPPSVDPENRVEHDQLAPIPNSGANARASGAHEGRGEVGADNSTGDTDDGDSSSDWARCHPVGLRDSGHCHEQSPLLRFASLREKSSNDKNPAGCARLELRRSLSGLSGETTV